MRNETAGVVAESENRFAKMIERVLMREVAGMPVALIACALSAVVFGGLVAMSAGSP